MPDSTTDLMRRASEVRARHESELMAHSGVVGVGIGFRQRSGAITEEIAIVVMVVAKRPLPDLEPGEVLPSELEGVPVDVVETGRIESW